MSRKVFTAGEVLAAADVNSFLMDQTVMSFAGTAARGSAIASPVEGMYTHLEDTDSLQFWNGSSWVSPFGTTLLATSTFAGSSLAAIDNVFTSEFDNYKIVFDITGSTSSELRLRLRDATVPTTSSSYENGLLDVGSADSAAFASTDSALVTYFSFGSMSTASNLNAGEATIYSPKLSKRTRMTSVATGTRLTVGGYETTVTTSFDGFAMFPSSGTFSGTIRVYGWRNS
jgi:hypothetical protein